MHAVVCHSLCAQAHGEYAHVFDAAQEIEESLAEALEWCSKRGPAARRAYRERIMEKMEKKSFDLFSSGKVPEWYMRAQEDLQAACGCMVNGTCSCTQGLYSLSVSVFCSCIMPGPLIQKLAKNGEYCNQGVAELFRQGGALVGLLPATGPCNIYHGASAQRHVHTFVCLVGTGKQIPVAVEEALDVLDLEAAREKNNAEMISSLRADPHGEELLAMVQEEIKLGRMRRAASISVMCALRHRFM